MDCVCQYFVTWEERGLWFIVEVSSSTESLCLSVNGAVHSVAASHFKVFSLSFFAKPPEVDMSAMMLPGNSYNSLSCPKLIAGSTRQGFG